MLSTTRRRVLPATLLASGALALGVLGTTIPAQAAEVVPTSTVATTSVVTTSTVARATVAPATVTPAMLAAQRAMRIRFAAVSIAESRIGSAYRAGRSGPRAFDCSGLALYVVRKATGRTLPHYSKAQFAVTKRVSRANLRPGDLVFFFRHGTHHVGVYIGGGRMVSATNPRGGVRIDSVFTGWYGSRYSGAGRLV